MLKHFCFKIGRLYRERCKSYNVHKLLHMTNSVSPVCPLLCLSAFWDEDYNDDYKHVFHGTQNVNFQIVTNVLAFQKLPKMSGTIAHTVYHVMSVKVHQSVKVLGKFILPDVNCVGPLHLSELPLTEKVLLWNYLLKVKESYKFMRVSFKGKVIHSKEYTRVSK